MGRDFSQSTCLLYNWSDCACMWYTLSGTDIVFLYECLPQELAWILPTEWISWVSVITWMHHEMYAKHSANKWMANFIVPLSYCKFIYMNSDARDTFTNVASCCNWEIHHCVSIQKKECHSPTVKTMWLLGVAWMSSHTMSAMLFTLVFQQAYCILHQSGLYSDQTITTAQVNKIVSTFI